MGLWDLFVTASVPVLNVLLVTAVGSFLATGRIGVLGEDARKHLNNVVFFVFNPALVYTNLSRTITYESMMLLWFMPINILFTFIIGSTLGWVLIQITRPPSHLRGLILGCCAAGNLGNMLLIIIPAICKEKGSPFGDPVACHTYGMGYVSLSMAIGAIFLWSYVYNIVRISARENNKEDNVSDCKPSTSFIGETSMLLPGSRTGAVRSINGGSMPKYLADQGNEKVPISVRLKELVRKFSNIVDLKKLLAPSTNGVIIGFIVGVIPQVRRALIGESAPLRVIQDSATLLGDGAIPTVTLVMGGNLLKGLSGQGIRFSLIVGIVAVRYIVLPLCGVVIIKGAIHFGLVHSDPLYQFVLLVQYAVPPAMNIGTITQLFGAGESECSVIMLWCYALASVSLTCWSATFMWLVS